MPPPHTIMVQERIDTEEAKKPEREQNIGWEASNLINPLCGKGGRRGEEKASHILYHLPAPRKEKTSILIRKQIEGEGN